MEDLETDVTSRTKAQPYTLWTDSELEENDQDDSSGEYLVDKCKDWMLVSVYKLKEQ